MISALPSSVRVAVPAGNATVDIKLSIAELRYYRETLFRAKGG